MNYRNILKNQGNIVWGQWGAYFEEGVVVFPKKIFEKICMYGWTGASDQNEIIIRIGKNANIHNFLKIRVSSC